MFKRWVFLTLTWALFVAGSGGGLRSADAAEWMAGENVAVPESRTVDDDLAAAGSNVLIQGRVNGDVMAAGANVTLSGSVQDDVLAAGANVTVSAPVGDDVRAAGANVTVSGPVGDNVMLAGRTVILSSTARVGRDAEIAGASVEVQGNVGRNLSVAAEDVRLAAEVGGSVRAHVRRLRLLPGAQVRGDLVVYAPVPPEVSPEARVLGRIQHHPVEAAPQRAGRGNWFFGWLLQFLWLLVVGVAVVAFSHRWADRVAETVVRHPGAAALTGFLALLLAPIVSGVLLMTLIGIPLALILMGLYLVALLLAGAFVSYTVGAWLLTRRGGAHPSPYTQLALGALVVSVLMALPWIGWLFALIVVLLGFGALALERRDAFRRLRTGELA